MKSFSLVLGSSGTGKGTRVNQLITFLKTREEPQERFFGKHHLGLYFKSIDTLFLGKYNHNKKSNHTTWSSMDGLWSKFGGTEQTVSAIKEMPEHIVCEGYSNMDTFRVRPVHMSGSGCSRFFYQVYSYGEDNIQEYKERIMLRQGKPPKGDTAFGKERQILKFPSKIRDEFNQIGIDKDDGVVFDLPFDETVISFGAPYLFWRGYRELCEEFVQWSEENTVLYEYTPPEPSVINELF